MRHHPNKRTLNEQDMVDDALGQLAEAQKDLDACLAERDDLIVDAIEAGAIHREISEITGLSSGGLRYRLNTAKNGSKYLSPRPAGGTP